MSDQPEAAPSHDDKIRFADITLSEPITRGETEIAKLRLRKPRAGELRGLSLQDLITSDITALLTVIPRVSEPPLTADEANNLEPEDLAEAGGAIRGFFMTKAERALIEAMAAEHRPKT